MSVHVCPICGAQFVSRIAMEWCCDEAAYGDDD